MSATGASSSPPASPGRTKIKSARKGATPKEATQPNAPVNELSEKQLRVRLRKIFDKFDLDGSGAVSTEEMGTMLKTLQMDVTPEALKQMMIDADPDKSGEIDFEEFVVVLKKQMKEGGSSTLATAVTSAGGAFGWLNPMSWFAGEEKPARGRKPGSPSSNGSPKRTLSPGPYYSENPSLVSTNFEPSYRMKATQGLTQAANQEVAAEHRQTNAAWQSFHKAQQEHFLYRQQQRIRDSHQQGRAKNVAVEELKQHKREMGKNMKEKIEEGWEKELQKKREHVAKGRKRVIEAKDFKQGRVNARKELMRAASAEAYEKGRIERADRKELTKSTQRAEALAAKHYAAQVRYDTRPATRKEGRDMFQAQRDMVVINEKIKQTNDKMMIEEARQAYLDRVNQQRASVQKLKEDARQARNNLLTTRQKDAKAMRAFMDSEGDRHERSFNEEMGHRRGLHDSIYNWNKQSMIPQFDD